jgi:peptidoglycan/xylan/chitin deacetylase (PgdA/CDA1 family)
MSSLLRPTSFLFIASLLLPGALFAQGKPVPPSDPVRVKALETEIAANPYLGKKAPKIVLKLDDLSPSKDGVSVKWTRVADFAKSRNIKVSFGIIAAGMEQGNPAFYDWVKARHADGSIEFWHHGWDHKERTDEASKKKVQEFSGESYEHQKKHMTDANRVAKEKLGFAFVTFGAPFNKTDESTVKVLTEDPDLKVWLYGDVQNPAGKTVLIRRKTNLEVPTFIPNYAAFLETYSKERGADYFILQGHPGNWSDDRWAQFVLIVDFLIAQKAEFVLPRDFLPPSL